MSSGRWHGSAGLARERLRLRVSLHVFQHHLAAWGQVQEGREGGAWWVEQVGLRGGAAGLQMLGLGLKLQGWHMWSPAHLPFSQVSWSLQSMAGGTQGAVSEPPEQLALLGPHPALWALRHSHTQKRTLGPGVGDRPGLSSLLYVPPLASCAPW